MALDLEKLKNEISVIMNEESMIEAPTLIAEMLEYKIHDLIQVNTLQRHALKLIKDALEGDSYQGHAFDRKRMLTVVNCALEIKDTIYEKKEKIPQIVEKGGEFSIEQIELPAPSETPERPSTITAAKELSEAIKNLSND